MAQNFLIVGTQRTGSQALYKGLNQHPEIFCGGEWLQHIGWHRKRSVAERVFAGDFRVVVSRRPQDQKRIEDYFTRDVRWLGFKILFRASDKWVLRPQYSPALFFDRIEQLLAWLRCRSDIHVIQLVRQDTLEWLKSKHLARATGMFNHKKYPDGQKVAIPIRSAIRSAAAKGWVDSRLSAINESNPYHRVYYEDFLKDNNGALETCLRFLRCDPSKLPTDAPFTERQSRGSAEDYIQNHDELVAALKSRQLLESNV